MSAGAPPRARASSKSRSRRFTSEKAAEKEGSNGLYGR
jgi:hypothetical protein